MQRRALPLASFSLAVAAIGLVSGHALAQDAAAAKPPPASRYLAPEQTDPARLLPPPPAEGSPRAKDELAELHRLQTARTTAGFAQAMADDENESVLAFAEVMGPGFDLQRLPATAKLFKDLRSEDSAAAKRAKAFFKRLRPRYADPTITSCETAQEGPNAYPSGHATMAYAAAAVLADLAPARAQAVMTRANDYAENRLVCEDHRRRDIVAGEALGTVLAVQLMANPAFHSELEAARAELKAAHVVD